MTLTIILLILGLALLVFAADWLVKGAASIAAAVGISPLIVGLTVVAFGTSAPELAVSVMSAFQGQADLAVGNVVGSNIFNILVVLGLSALIIPLIVHRQLIRFDLPVMIFLSLLLYWLSRDGSISRIDGLILFAIAVAYTVVLILQSKREKNSAVLTEYEEEYGKATEDPKWLKNLLLIALGMGGLVLGSKWLVDGAVEIARFFGVSELIIGLTIVSVGTSLPEVATSVVAAMKGERDIAVGNVVGSNIFNIVTVLGISSIVAPNGIHVPAQAFGFDLPVMIAVALASLPIFFYGYKIGRAGGIFFLGFYGSYIAYLILEATQSAFFPQYRHAMLSYVAPAVAVGLLIVLIRAIKQGKNLA
ncbi:calcium/sodium antiporter [Luteolibacter algae]|uniref:Calcium/sodium antiporter n=2 Tax=Luteolibacter algae TaxID=454151 RepID=A0ABW5D7P3_9BACT